MVEEGCSDREVFGSEEWVEVVFGERDDRGADEGGGVLEVLWCEGRVITFSPLRFPREDTTIMVHYK